VFNDLLQKHAQIQDSTALIEAMFFDKNSIDQFLRLARNSSNRCKRVESLQVLNSLLELYARKGHDDELSKFIAKQNESEKNVLIQGILDALDDIRQQLNEDVGASRQRNLVSSHGKEIAVLGIDKILLLDFIRGCVSINNQLVNVALAVSDFIPVAMVSQE
jgi:hypothetical protein